MITLKNKTLILLFAICTLSFSCKNSPEQTEIKPSQIAVDKFQTIINSMYQSNPESIGIAVHIESPENGISWSGSAGYSNRETKAKLLSYQPALIASNTKTYISASILRLQEENKLSIEDNISKYLTQKTTDLFKSDGYDVDAIAIKHLLSHTSGIEEYTNDDYINFIDKNKEYRWTREEQLQRAVAVGNPLGKPQELFNYADGNYLLCTEIIEEVTKKPFYEAIRNLLKYDELVLNNTWFPTLEAQPKGAKELVHQYWTEKGWDSKNMDISFDLYGGGGIATTTKELAQFSYHLFNQNIIEDKDVLKLLSSKVKTADGKNNSYGLGLSIGNTKGFKRYGHGGFWGSQVLYFPKLRTSISVFVLEKDMKSTIIKNTTQKLVAELTNQLYLEDTIMTENYQLYKAKNTKATLVLYPGGGTTSKETKKEFDIINLANANNISVALMNFNRHLWIDTLTTIRVANELEQLFKENELNPENICIGGMSIGGNVALTLSNYLHQSQSIIKPEGTFIIDSPIDLYALYKSSLKDILNPNLDEERLAEPKFIIDYFEEAFSKDSLLMNIAKVSPFTQEKNHINVSNLKDIKLRFYTEPDSLWQKINRQTDFESTNAYTIQQVAKDLIKENWNQFELIETKNKGYRSNGERHPHSWSIVDANELMKWIKK
ncbi:serine hydrolase domain-containing protein [Maribacter chungangensis]|uniref:Serine hydrolase domain-containing protein n=1 Tax=Maribacter chungangensis TaxID=1069117 RepID=A0ABW3B1D5_9FLAO